MIGTIRQTRCNAKNQSYRCSSLSLEILESRDVRCDSESSPLGHADPELMIADSGTGPNDLAYVTSPAAGDTTVNEVVENKSVAFPKN